MSVDLRRNWWNCLTSLHFHNYARLDWVSKEPLGPRLVAQDQPTVPKCWKSIIMDSWRQHDINKKHLKNVGPIRYCEPPHAHSPGVACASMSTTTPDNDDDNNNAWQRGLLWPHGMGPINYKRTVSFGSIFETKRQSESCIVFKEICCKWIPPKIVCVLQNNITCMSTGVGHKTTVS